MNGDKSQKDFNEGVSNHKKWLFAALLLISSLLFICCKVNTKKPAIKTNPEENPTKKISKKTERWTIAIPQDETLNYKKEHHFLLAKNENGRIIVFDKNIQNGFEKSELEYPNFSESDHQPILV